MASRRGERPRGSGGRPRRGESASRSPGFGRVSVAVRIGAAVAGVALLDAAEPPVGIAAGPRVGISARAVDVAVRESPPADAARRDTVEFRHADHRGVACVTCHPSEEQHGGLAVTRREDCLECHHRDPGQVVCADCHAERELRGERRLSRRLELSTGTAAERPLSFDHAEHEDVGCTECHTGGLRLSAGDLSCAECHEEHHGVDARCVACHVEAAEDAHPVETAHVTCGGSGCHTTLPFDRVPRSRPACLSCHQDLLDHRPGRPCVECHPTPQREPAERETRSGGTGE